MMGKKKDKILQSAQDIAKVDAQEYAAEITPEAPTLSEDLEDLPKFPEPVAQAAMVFFKRIEYMKAAEIPAWNMCMQEFAKYVDAEFLVKLQGIGSNTE